MVINKTNNQKHVDGYLNNINVLYHGQPKLNFSIGSRKKKQLFLEFSNDACQDL